MWNFVGHCFTDLGNIPKKYHFFSASQSSFWQRNRRLDEQLALKGLRYMAKMIIKKFIFHECWPKADYGAMQSKCNDHGTCKNDHKLFFNSTRVDTLLHICTQEHLILKQNWMGWMVRDSAIIFSFFLKKMDECAIIQIYIYW